jgi:cold shock CspA family protein
MRRQGRIVEWNDARGFGFVLWHGGEERAFAHIKAFADRGARPAVGDVVTYEVAADPGGRMRASDIRYAGAAAVARQRSVASERQRPYERVGQRGRPGMGEQVLGALFFIAIVAGVVWYRGGQQERRLADAAASPSVRGIVDAAPAVGGFSCDGRQYCSQMTSCAEAKFYLAHCPDTRMDGGAGGGDGVPCEEQWCDVPEGD